MRPSTSPAPPVSISYGINVYLFMQQQQNLHAYSRVSVYLLVRVQLNMRKFQMTISDWYKHVHSSEYCRLMVKKIIFMINRKLAKYTFFITWPIFLCHTVYRTKEIIYVSASSHSKKCPSRIGRRLWEWTPPQITITVYFKVLFGCRGFLFLCARAGSHNMNVHNVVKPLWSLLEIYNGW